MVDAALELFVRHGVVMDKERATQIILMEFREALLDSTMCALGVACYRAEEDAKAGLIARCSSNFFEGLRLSTG